jgi:hypothetical protein
MTMYHILHLLARPIFYWALCAIALLVTANLFIILTILIIYALLTFSNRSSVSKCTG